MNRSSAPRTPVAARTVLLALFVVQLIVLIGCRSASAPAPRLLVEMRFAPNHDAHDLQPCLAIALWSDGRFVIPQIDRRNPHRILSGALPPADVDSVVSAIHHECARDNVAQIDLAAHVCTWRMNRAADAGADSVFTTTSDDLRASAINRLTTAPGVVLEWIDPSEVAYRYRGVLVLDGALSDALP